MKTCLVVKHHYFPVGSRSNMAEPSLWYYLGVSRTPGHISTGATSKICLDSVFQSHIQMLAYRGPKHCVIVCAIWQSNTRAFFSRM